MEDLDVSKFIEKQVQEISKCIGDEKAIVATSGGVDSTVAAVMANRAIGESLLCVFIDDNFMRLGESEQVKNLLSNEPLNLKVKIFYKRQQFMEALDGLSDAEEKRKAFRETFYQTLREAAEEYE